VKKKSIKGKNKKKDKKPLKPLKPLKSLKPLKPLWLHLGCGKRNIPGFLNVDLADYPHIDYKRGVDDLSVFKTGTVDLIYASHILEYFDGIEVKRVLKEWRRVLKKGGVLRLAVPDFEALVKVYRKYKKLDLILGPLYGRWEIKGGKKTVYHKTVYDFKTLKKTLQDNGFKNVKRYDWRKIWPHKEYDDYSQAYIPHMQKDKGILISLNVQAVKR
jgi:predicted SAM-dependent methyltransferase